ncbi:hypothetical protein A6V36_36405 [Paraburkholderia ginsengiterrae]|uniref:YycE-like N-terminal domain-containing protein n=1 Tax=Paraburkholderia ginsengiterrae TaxID=1462993 RepID=A0A1A9MXK9_9BURK|nr:hypothetical protein [Paraburkholderia ginsengiterrae]OAJ52899.1 hypothetical protein A6V37_36135 [Paraburkholderia ginsengiterrae]OAJ54231.1 hypothetical protein A6V36_36405 [Paraburkholderia ginsengiterrae]
MSPVARPTNDIDLAARFYTQRLRFEELAEFADHEEFDGIFLGHANYPWHIELTHLQNATVANAPTREHLLVIHLIRKAVTTT